MSADKSSSQPPKPSSERSPLEDYRPKRLFTVEQANAVLPLARAIVRDLAQLSQEVIERRERLGHLAAGRPGAINDVYRQEVAQIEQELEKDTVRLKEYIEELRELGVEPKNGPEGLIDFPAVIEGRLVFLCWKLGEAQVQHWHELDAGFAGRRKLDPRPRLATGPVG